MSFLRSFVALLLLGGVAAAQQPPDLLALGKLEFESAQREFNLGHFESALEHFETSYRLTAKPGLLYNIGYTYRQLYQRTRNPQQLELAIERFKTFLVSVPEIDAATRASRERTQNELRGAEKELAEEQAASARGEETLVLGESLLAKGRIAEAREQLTRFLSATDNERAGIARAWLLDGSIAIADGRIAHALEAYASALSLDRSRQLPPGSPPAAKTVFAQAQERLGAIPPLGVTHTPPGSLKTGRPIELNFNVIADPQHLISGLLLFYRAGDGAFSALPSQQVGKIVLPSLFSAALLPGARVDYYGLVVDANSGVLEHLGSPQLPFSAPVDKPRGPPVTKRAWFWSVLGVSAAVIATGIGLAVHFTQAPSYNVGVQATSAALGTR